MSAAKKNITITESIVPFIFHGYTNSITTCDCCGRDGLKVTVALWDAVEAQEVYFGTTCAARAMSIGVKEVKYRADAAELARIEAEAEARAEAHRIEMAAWCAWLSSRFAPVYDSGSDRLNIFATCKRAGLTVGQAMKMRAAEMAA